MGMSRRATDITSEVRDGVAAGWLAEGERLGGERDLLAAYGASRATVREALRILEADGYVTVRRGPRGGAFVRRPTRQDLARTLSAHLELAGATPLEVAGIAALVGALRQAAGLNRNRALCVLSDTLSLLADESEQAERVA
jgi:DNA-binding FadR family transcriptional regulator